MFYCKFLMLNKMYKIRHNLTVGLIHYTGCLKTIWHIWSSLLICHQISRQTNFTDHMKIWWVVVGTWHYNLNGSGWLLNAIRESVERVCVCVCVSNSAPFRLRLVNNVTWFTGCFHPELFFFRTMHNYCVRIWCQISDFQWTIRAVRVHLLPAASDQQPLSHHVCRALKLSIPSVRQHVMKTWLLLLISQLCDERFKSQPQKQDFKDGMDAGNVSLSRRSIQWHIYYSIMKLINIKYAWGSFVSWCDTRPDAFSFSSSHFYFQDRCLQNTGLTMKYAYPWSLIKCFISCTVFISV